MVHIVTFPDVKDALARITRGERATTENVNVLSILQFWLWGSDANETCDRGKCDFHLMHLSGMVCTRVFSEAYQLVGDEIDYVPSVVDDDDIHTLIDRCRIFLPHFYGDDSVDSVVQPIENRQFTNTFNINSENQQPKKYTHHDKIQTAHIHVPDSVTLQQLRDLVHAIQTQWNLIQKALQDSHTKEEKLELLQIIDRLVTQIFIWFGYYLFNSNIEDWQADDKEFVDNIPPTHALALTDMGIKFYINIFFVLFRLLFLQRHAVAVPTGKNSISGCYPFSIETFHLEAGVDDFHLLGMYYDIPAGCLLEYKHSYSGYYNNVSQVVYKHFPSYKRRLPISLSDVLCQNASDIFVLPCLKQIYPEIDFAFEDHHFFREVAGVRVAVLLASSRLEPTTLSEKPLNLHDKQKKSTPPHSDKNISEKLQARLNACRDGINISGGSSGLDAACSSKPTHWFWFTVGANIYLVSIDDGVAYSGSCKDLLTFYLSNTHTH